MDIEKALSEITQIRFFDELIQYNIAYKPKLLSNNSDQGSRVLSTVIIKNIKRKIIASRSLDSLTAGISKTL